MAVQIADPPLAARDHGVTGRPSSSTAAAFSRRSSSARPSGVPPAGLAPLTLPRHMARPLRGSTSADQRTALTRARQVEPRRHSEGASQLLVVDLAFDSDGEGDQDLRLVRRHEPEAVGEPQFTSTRRIVPKRRASTSGSSPRTYSARGCSAKLRKLRSRGPTPPERTTDIGSGIGAWPVPAHAASRAASAGTRRRGVVMGAEYAERVTADGETRAPLRGTAFVRQLRYRPCTTFDRSVATSARLDLALVLDRDDGHGGVEGRGGERDGESATGERLLSSAASGRARGQARAAFRAPPVSSSAPPSGHSSTCR